MGRWFGRFFAGLHGQRRITVNPKHQNQKECNIKTDSNITHSGYHSDDIKAMEKAWDAHNIPGFLRPAMRQEVMATGQTSIMASNNDVYHFYIAQKQGDTTQ